MNYAAGASLAGGGLIADGRALPVNDDWRRVNYALAGYGYVVPGSVSDAEPVACESSVARTCTATSSIEVV